MCNTSKDSVALIVEKSRNEKTRTLTTFKRNVVQWVKEFKVSKIIFYFLIMAISCLFMYLIYHNDLFNHQPKIRRTTLQPQYILEKHKKSLTQYERSRRSYHLDRGLYKKKEL